MTGSSTRFIRDILKLTNLELVGTILERTSMGYQWKEGHTGGRKVYLSDIDQIIYFKAISDATTDIYCIPTCIARKLAMAVHDR